MPLLRRLVVLLDEPTTAFEELVDLTLFDAPTSAAVLGSAQELLTPYGGEVCDLSEALQIVGRARVQREIQRLLEAAAIPPTREHMERVRFGVVHGLASESLARILEGEPPRLARAAGLLRGGMPPTDSLVRRLPGRFARVLRRPEEPRSQHPGDVGLEALLDLSGQLAVSFGCTRPDGAQNVFEGAHEAFEIAAEPIRERVASEVEDGVTVFGLALGQTDFTVSSLVERGLDLWRADQGLVAMTPGLAVWQRHGLAMLRGADSEGRTLRVLVQTILSSRSVEATLLVLNERGRAIGGQGLPFHVLTERLPSELDLDLDQGAEAGARAASEPPLRAAGDGWWAAPLSAGAKVIGHLLVRTSAEPSGGFSAGLVALAGAASRRLEVLQYSRRSRLVDEALHHDSLTGVLNRGAILAALEDEVRRANRHRAPLAVAMVDVDDFKRWNEERGHQAGDRALVRIATHLKESVRDGDLVGRYGGDEFLAVLPGADVERARAVAERMRVAVHAAAQEDLAEDPDGPSLGVTLGVAALAEFPGDGATLIFRADHALIAAKRSGKDQVGLSS